MKKRKLAVALLVVMTAMFSLLLIEAEAEETLYVSNVDYAVYLRENPASDSYVTTIPLGTAVTSVGWEKGSDGAGYNQVKYDGRSGWVKTCYLSNSRSGDNQNSGGTWMVVTGVSNAVYFRKDAGSDSYYTTIPLGTEVESIGWKKGSDGVGYNQIKYGGDVGWVTTKYLKNR